LGLDLGMTLLRTARPGATLSTPRTVTKRSAALFL
jgi:hypothetical protein